MKIPSTGSYPLFALQSDNNIYVWGQTSDALFTNGVDLRTLLLQVSNDLDNYECGTLVN